jgi:hypothetical protein
MDDIELSNHPQRTMDVTRALALPVAERQGYRQLTTAPIRNLFSNCRSQFKDSRAARDVRAQRSDASLSLRPFCPQPASRWAYAR